MTDHILNYVRCPYCGGNAAVNHECDDEARQQAANESFARFMGAVNADPADATADQLRVKLAECEEALRAMEDTVREQDAVIERLRADDDGVAHFVASGAVRDAGGGEIHIVIDRETEHYPALGTRVALWTIPS